MRWVPLYGQFDVATESITFNGRLVASGAGGSENVRDGSDQAPLIPGSGAIISDCEITSGRVSATVEFKSPALNTGCELILGYDIETRGFISAGIPGDGVSFFGIHELHPGVPGGQAGAEQAQWITLQAGGDRSFISGDRPYRIAAELLGNRISLSIDGVRLASANLRTPVNRARPVGGWCQSHANVTITDFTVAAERPRAFVVMQFASPFNEVYSDVIRDTCEEFGLETFRADEVYGPGVIIHDIIEQLMRAQVVIAEITPSNPNVYFEVGYAFAWGKPVILLARKGTELPFDVSGFRVLFYEDSIGGKNRLKEGLARHLRAIVGTDPTSS